MPVATVVFATLTCTFNNMLQHMKVNNNIGGFQSHTWIYTAIWMPTVSLLLLQQLVLTQ